MRKTGNNKFLKEFNETTLLRLIRANHQISKVGLSELTGLSPTACGMIVANLAAKEYIREAGTGVSKGGRKPVLYELNAGSYYSIGVDIDIHSVRIILMDITGQAEHRAQLLTCGTDFSVHEAMETVEQQIRRIIASNGIQNERLLGVGISVPGIVDHSTNEIIFAPNLGWERVDLRDMLQGVGEFPVYVDNEAMCSAIYENWSGSCVDEKDFVCINMESGIGSGIFAGGSIYRGCGGSAGEIGHIMVEQNGPKCACGNYGCLETLSSTRAIVQKARKLIRQGLIADFQESESITVDDIIDSAQKGNESARAILIEAAGYLGLAAANLLNTVNPSKIVLGKDFVKFPDSILEHLKNIAFAKALKYPASKAEIIKSGEGDDSSALGAAIIPLKKLFGILK